jgi:hypothetical protein
MPSIASLSDSCSRSQCRLKLGSLTSARRMVDENCYFTHCRVTPCNRLMLTFFTAGLLFICGTSTSITWERTASRRRRAFSSHLLTTVDFRFASDLKQHGRVLAGVKSLRGADIAWIDWVSKQLRNRMRPPRNLRS